MTPDQARQRFIDEHPSFKEAAASLCKQLEELCSVLRVPAVVEAREKSIGSFVKKIYLKGYNRPWEEITDKVGARIVVGSLRDLNTLCDALNGEAASQFAPREITDKSEQADVEHLHYPGVHAQITVPGVLTSDGQAIEAELQLRTRAQDLWAVASHKLIYKGAVTPARQTQRRILRLSVLTEMFDEEVRTAMGELAADSAYLDARYLQVVEAEYLRFAGEPGHDLLSLEIIKAIRPALKDGGADFDATEAELQEFATKHLEKLQTLYARFGVLTEWSQQPAYWLFTQPESIIFFFLIETRPLALSQVVRGTELEVVADRLYAAWGRSMPAISD